MIVYLFLVKCAISPVYLKLESDYGLTMLRDDSGRCSLQRIQGVSVMEYRIVDNVKFSLFILSHPDMIHSIEEE